MKNLISFKPIALFYTSLYLDIVYNIIGKCEKMSLSTKTY